jgi:tRNA A-37 threonylcarbamoyl transferase component Bud32
LLDKRSVVEYLVGRGILPPQRGVANVEVLGGGVSNVVMLVEAGNHRFIVKQPRGRLLVQDEWLAHPDRVLAEARAITLVRTSTPDAAPAVVDLDSARRVLTLQAAPREWRSWKETLLEGTVDDLVGQRLGLLLGTWHRAGTSQVGGVPELEDLKAFRELRIEPFHRTVALKHPELAAQLDAATRPLLSGGPNRTLVHGDFSPKNVLVGLDGLWVIDFEVAHIGDPVFDLAFLVAHLVLKSLHRPGCAGAYRACAASFLDTYAHTAGPRFIPVEDSLGLQAGCLLLARVDGKSPAEYLTEPERVAAWGLGLRLVNDRVHPLSVWPLPGQGGPS